MLQEMADSVGLVMLQNGDDPGAVTDETFNRRSTRSRRPSTRARSVASPGNDYAQPLTNGDLAAAVAWSGDVVQLLADNPKLKWAIPESGGMIWTDNMLIPTGGSAPTASTYMNFVYDPVVAAQIAAYVNYVTPVKGAKEELAKTRSGDREQPADLPGRQHALAGQAVRLGSARQRGLHHALAGSPGPVGARLASARHRTDCAWERSSTVTRA